jgi:hypothetical protein
VLRYSVSRDKLTRIAPIALTRSSFIDEWVRVIDPMAWSAPEALEGHRAIHEFSKLHKGDEHFYFLCPGSPQTWQIVTSSAFNAPTKNWVFVLAEDAQSGRCT